jgi:inositol transport system substrate-binding protein
MAKHVFPGLLAGILAATVIASVSEPAEVRQLRVAYAAANLAWPFQAFIAHAAQAAGKQAGVDILLMDGTGSSPKQSSDLRNAVTQGVDGIVLNANDVDAIVPAVNEVIEARIPIVTIDGSVRGAAKPVPHFGPDNVAGGAKMARYVIDHFPEGAQMVFLEGQPGTGPALDRARGVHETLKKAGDKYKLLIEQPANWARALGRTVTQNVLTSLGKAPDAILCANDDMALGAVQALQQAGVPNGQVMVIGFDALPEALAAIRDGSMAATVDQLPGQQVKNAIDAIVGHLQDKKPLEARKLDPLLIDKTNLPQAGRFNELK